MAAYAGLAFLSFLWGSSFLLIKIASRAFDPFGFALARVGVAAAAMLLTSALSGKVWPGSRPGLWAKLLALALIGQVDPLLAARQGGDADDERRHGADDGRSAHLRLSVRPLSGIARSLDVARRRLASRSASSGSPSRSGRRVRIAAPIPSWGGPSPWLPAFPMGRARSSPAPQRGRSAQSER